MSIVGRKEFLMFHSGWHRIEEPKKKAVGKIVQIVKRFS
jgi:hypothetical protein